jgi:asparagine synthase (glutamine-hydrolysing)
MQRLLDEHLSGRVDHNFRLWILLNLEIWHRLCVEGQSRDELRVFIDGLGGVAAAAPASAPRP